MTAAIELMSLAIIDLGLGLDFRLDDDAEALDELAASIAEIGVLQPLVVRRAGGAWEVVAGRRRLAAARQAGLADVPCIVRDLTDEEAADIALVENMHRRDLSAVEEGLAFARLRDLGLTQTAIASRVGRSQAHVSALLRVLELPEELRDRIHNRQMNYRTALDLWGRRRFRSESGGAHTAKSLSGATAELVTYWRRRHDRLLGGVQATARARANGMSISGVLSLLDRLVTIDAEPLPSETPKELPA